MTIPIINKTQHLPLLFWEVLRKTASLSWPYQWAPRGLWKVAEDTDEKASSDLSYQYNFSLLWPFGFLRPVDLYARVRLKPFSQNWPLGGKSEPLIWNTALEVPELLWDSPDYPWHHRAQATLGVPKNLWPNRLRITGKGSRASRAPFERCLKWLENDHQKIFHKASCWWRKNHWFVMGPQDATVVMECLACPALYSGIH